MNRLKQDMARIQELIGNAFTQTGGLIALADGGQMSSEKLQRRLEKTADEFERSTLELRCLCERYSPGVGGYGAKPALSPQTPTGHVDMLNGRWLHIQLNTLLPHCRYRPPTWLSDTIRRLLDEYECGKGQLPYLNRALLVIDEHSDVSGRHVFDQDNKGWKAVSNAIKGKLIPDDDQYTLGVVLLSEQSKENICHISLLPQEDATEFFSLRSEHCHVRDFYGGE
jgi:hypothetical protein